MGVCLVLVQRKTTRQYHWVVLTMNRSHRYFFEPYPIWFGTNFPFRPLKMSNSCYGVPLSNGDRRSPRKLSCMFSQALKNLWKISENLWLHFVPLNYSDSLWFTLNIRGYSWTKAFGPSSETTMSRQKNKAEETAIEHLDLLVGRISESFDAVFSRYFIFRFLYRHPGSTDMFFTFIHEANHWKRITRWYLYSWPFLIVCCHGFPFSIFHFRHVELQPCHKMCFLIAGEHSRQAAKAPPPRAPAAVVPTLRPKSEVRPPLPITDGTASFDPPRRPPGPMSVVLEGVQKIGRPPAAPRSLAPLQRPPLRSSRSSWSRRPRQTRSRSDSRARSWSPGPSVSEVRSEARSLQQAHHTYPPGDWETSLGVFDIYGHSGQFQERPPPPPPPPRPVVQQTVRSAPNASLSAPLGSAPFYVFSSSFSIPSTPSGHVQLKWSWAFLVWNPFEPTSQGASHFWSLFAKCSQATGTGWHFVTRFGTHENGHVRSQLFRMESGIWPTGSNGAFLPFADLNFVW